jgi:hypothetical protein
MSRRLEGATPEPRVRRWARRIARAWGFPLALLVLLLGAGVACQGCAHLGCGCDGGLPGRSYCGCGVKAPLPVAAEDTPSPAR